METDASSSLIVVSHESALRGIRFARCRYGLLPWSPLTTQEQRDMLERARVGKTAVDRDELARLGFCDWDVNDDMHLLTHGTAARRRPAGIKVHSTRIDVSSGLFLKVAPNIVLPTPELCFVQCCEKLSFEGALALGLELCGTFSMSEAREIRRTANDGEPGYHECEGAMTVRGLIKAIERLPHMNGVRTARIVARCLLDNARSPMEAIMAGMFHPPFSQGGFGVEDMLLNYEIPFDRTAVDASDMTHAICDAFIPSAKVALEYNGSYHDEPNARIHDERRSLGLATLGIATLPLNHDTLQNVDALEAVARVIYERKGERYRDRTKKSAVKRVELLNGLRTAFGLKPC